MNAKSMFVLIAALGYLSAAIAQPNKEVGRGELLYSTYCDTCHTAQVHWRDKKLATDWASLKAEVFRWQEIDRLAWDEHDVKEVTRYLNARYYHYPAPQR